METPTEQIDTPAVRPGEEIKPGQKPPKPPKGSKQKNYRMSWPVVFVIVLLIAAVLGGWAYFGNVRLQGVANSRDEELKHRTAEVKDLTKDLAKAKADLVAHKAQDATDAQYLTISEWGVKFKPGADLAGFTYVMKGGNVVPTTKSLMTAAWEKAPTSPATGDYLCSPASYPLGYITRGKADDSAGVGPGAPTAFKNVAGAVKVGDYYYAHVGPQAGCSLDKTTQDLETKQTAAVKEAVKAFTSAQ